MAKAKESSSEVRTVKSKVAPVSSPMVLES